MLNDFFLLRSRQFKRRVHHYTDGFSASARSDSKIAAISGSNSKR